MTEEFDNISDELIRTLCDENKTNVERQVASRKLYQRHANWVFQQIGRKIFNPDDIADIAQNLWLMVLEPARLSENYTPCGKFRAYLRNPIRWVILKHIDKLPFSLNDQGEKTTARFVDIEDNDMEQRVDEHLYEEVVENIIKPNLKTVALKPRNAYMTSEHSAIFIESPEISEMAQINDISDSQALDLFTSAARKPVSDCTDEELSVFVPVKYRDIVDESDLEQSRGSHLASILGTTDAAFRKNLHTAKKLLLEIVQKNLDKIVSRDTTHGY